MPEIESSGRDLVAMIADLGEHPERYINNENENLRRSGERVWVAWTNQGVFDKNGVLTEVLCIGNDITDNRLKDLLRANDQAVQAMALAIEMRDPYTTGHQQRVTSAGLRPGPGDGPAGGPDQGACVWPDSCTIWER